jgi:hypothetical protein
MIQSTKGCDTAALLYYGVFGDDTTIRFRGVTFRRFIFTGNNLTKNGGLLHHLRQARHYEENPEPTILWLVVNLIAGCLGTENMNGFLYRYFSS